jgi:hypothetical protein
VVAAEYMSRRWQAARRAELLDSLHAGNSSRFPNDNPSSGMHHLIRSVSSDRAGQ